MVEGLGLVLGLGVELALEGGDAELVLAQGGAAPAELRVEAHQRAVDGLLEGIEGEQLLRGAHGPFVTLGPESVAATGVIYTLFSILLRTPLPSGPLGF